jgi:hypothetical protein
VQLVAVEPLLEQHAVALLAHAAVLAVHQVFDDVARGQVDALQVAQHVVAVRPALPVAGLGGELAVGVVGVRPRSSAVGLGRRHRQGADDRRKPSLGYDGRGTLWDVHPNGLLSFWPRSTMTARELSPIRTISIVGGVRCQFGL